MLHLRPLVLLLVVALLAGRGAARAGDPAADPGAPRTLVLALDGVPWRVMLEARRQGAFAGWPEPVPLVSTFPSLTNVAFTAIFEPCAVAPAAGYEVRHFDIAGNRIVGGSLRGYGERLNAWRDLFDITGRTVGSKLSSYTGTRRKAWKDLARAELELLDSPRALVLAHIGATDAMMHLRGDAALLRFLVELERRLAELKRLHELARGGPLRVILLSDHGNGNRKIRSVRGLRRDLRRAGLRVTRHLRRPGDVVAATFGLVNYGALFLRDADAETAARAAARNAAVELAAWRAAAEEIRVVSQAGVAAIRWHDGAQGRTLAYQPLTADPLELADLRARMQTDGLLDAEGFAAAGDWLRATALHRFPQPLNRLIDALDGGYVRNPATVLLSFAADRAWGWKAGHFSSRFNGGRLEGTHGGLDREASLGFYLADDPTLQPAGAVPAAEALARLVPLDAGPACRRP